MAKKKLVVLTGAGVSAESGLKTFRDNGGLWDGHDVYEVATPGAFTRNPELVLNFYNLRRREVAQASPNAAHIGLAALEKNYDVTIITQNIDDLHERAGSTNVIHLHGEIFKKRSVADIDTISEIRGDILVGDLAPDGSQYRPHIVWFEEPVPMIEVAARVTQTAEIFVVVGTSLVVYPAAGLVDYAPYQAPKFIIDRNIPYTQQLHNLTTIEKPAGEGVMELVEILKRTDVNMC